MSEENNRDFRFVSDKRSVSADGEASFSNWDVEEFQENENAILRGSSVSADVNPVIDVSGVSGPQYVENKGNSVYDIELENSGGNGDNVEIEIVIVGPEDEDGEREEKVLETLELDFHPDESRSVDFDWDIDEEPDEYDLEVRSLDDSNSLNVAVFRDGTNPPDDAVLYAIAVGGTGVDNQGEVRGYNLDNEEIVFETRVDGRSRTDLVYENGSLFMTDDEETARAIDAETGAQIWEADIIGSGDSVRFDVFEGVMYVICTDDGVTELIALDSEDGSEIYRVEVDGGVRDNVFVGDGKIYHPTSSSSVVAYDIEDGSEVWSAELENSPGSVYYYDGVVYAANNVNFRGPSTAAINSSDGSVVWDVFHNDYGDGDHVSSNRGSGVVATEDAVYAAGGGNSTELLKLDIDTGMVETSFMYGQTSSFTLDRIGNFLYILPNSNNTGIKVFDLESEVPRDSIMADIFGDDDTLLYGLTSNLYQLQRSS